MPKVHYFQRYSSRENTVTNNTLLLLSRIYSYSPERAGRLLASLTGDDEDAPEVGLQITQQTAGPESVPDGEVRQIGFRVLIEAKVDAPVEMGQLERHVTRFKDGEDCFLLLLSIEQPDQDWIESCRRRIARVRPNVRFQCVTYGQICDAALDLFESYETELQAWVQDYADYCEQSGLTQRSPHLMRIVPCGRSVELNGRYGIYFQPSDRAYSSHRFIGIYAAKAVHWIWELEAVMDVSLHADGRLEKSLVEGKDDGRFDSALVEIIGAAREECGYEVATDHRFFCGKPEPTRYVKESKWGIPGARYLDVRDLGCSGLDAPSLAARLRQETW